MKVYVCKTKGCQQGAVVILDELDIPPNVKSLIVKVGNQKYSLYAVPAGSLTDCPRCGMPIAEAKLKPKEEAGVIIEKVSMLPESRIKIDKTKKTPA